MPASRRRGGFGGLLLGGMIAAALGFGAAWLAHDRFGLFPARLPADLDQRLAALEAEPTVPADQVQALTDRLSQVEARLTTLEEAPAQTADATATAPAVDLEPLRAELAQEVQTAQERTSQLEQRIAALEARPAPPAGGEAPLGSLAAEGAPGPSAPAVDAEALRQEVVAALEPRLGEAESRLTETGSTLSQVQAAVDDLDRRLDAAEAASTAATQQAQAAASAATEMESRATAAEAQARRQAALSQVSAALDAGETFEAPLSDLAGTGVDIPGALTQSAGAGVPTLATLRETFPEAARAGLSAARDQGLLDDGPGVLGFLRGQLSFRSVTPREGQDPDAVLSRVEGDLGQGRLTEALAEIDSLPDPVKAAMADWISQAQARIDAEAALATLRDGATSSQATSAD
ncbi:COG4223 family protein [Rubellimicrobium arenae]|uniref:COG4223 family protein n=1 Tax=Rubellimicrobium arenae TaxID=2817372 RepID=UPI001B30385B|nr:hypothetical protein [Rubellimicrobium arenae]